MQKLTFTVDLTPVELRGMSATLLGMAEQIERNLNGVASDTIDASEDDNPFLGKFLLGDDGSEFDVYAKSPLTQGQFYKLPTEAADQWTGRIITSDDAGKSAADAFSNDDDATASEKNNDVDLDADGIPWDARIHGASKTKLARGNTWKLKRGVDKELVTTVIAELKALMSAPAATTSAPDNVTNIADAKPAGPAGPGPAKPAAPAQPAGPETPAVEVKYVTDDGEWTREQLKGALFTDEAIDALPIAGNVSPQLPTVEITFPELMQLVTPALAANTITNEQVTAACVKQGIASLNLIAARPDLIPAVKIELFG